MFLVWDVPAAAVASKHIGAQKNAVEHAGKG
jgi:hypothetical protein